MVFMSSKANDNKKKPGTTMSKCIPSIVYQELRSNVVFNTKRKNHTRAETNSNAAVHMCGGIQTQVSRTGMV